ncbi:MAG: PKD domain-containing protein [Flavobacteriales bacterium]|jgi:PKD repeat protein|nr:PKD domain-containing protein [Flavobacteriales bacterium]
MTMLAPARTLVAFGLWLTVHSQPIGLFAQTYQPNFSDALVMGGWVSPVGATWDANGRLYVWEKRGQVWIVENGVRLPNPLLNISDEVGDWRDHGFLGFALDPNFTTNGHIYGMYAVDRHHLMNHGTGSYNANTNEYYAATIMRITRWTAIGPSFNEVNYGTRQVLVGETRSTGVPLLHESHSTGSLMFGSDGTLLATVGDGASYNVVDVGSSSDTYWSQALVDGIIRPAENVGALRSQMLGSHNGKLLRIDPATGDGIPSNPWYNPAAPRSPQSRTFALGLRNPYRATIKPNSGSTNPVDANPGVIYIGDVQWGTWEDLNVCYEGGMNFGWPLFEGLTPHTGYMNALTANLDVPNPLYDGVNCTIQYLRFQDLLKQDTPIHLNGHPNPCNPAVQIPSAIPTHFHSRPVVDWLHGNQSRCGSFDGNTAVTYDLGASGSPVSGPQFGGNCAVGGPWMAGQNMPAGYQNSTFHGDYASGWIRRFMFNEQNQPVSVHDFATGLGAVVWIGAGPDGCVWYMKYNTNELRRICYTLAVNLPPVAVATQSVQYGPGPLTVNFNAGGSSDPENGALTYLWNFGNGSPNSTLPNPSRTFNAPPGVPTTYTVTLTVTDNIGQTATQQLIVSVNNTPPAVNITSIPLPAFYPVGIDTTFQLQAAVTDPEHGPAQLTYAWRTTLHHNTHTHPEPFDNNVSSSTVISGVGCDGETFFYVVSLTVTDAGGLSTTEQREIHPRCFAIAPTAIVLASASSGESPLAVTFDGTQSYDPGQIVSYAWDFGDGTSSTSPTPSKTFTDTGDHQVTLTVTDNDGLTGTAVKVISVLSFLPPQCPGAAGSLLREFWSNVSGSSVSDLINTPNYPNSPSGSSSLSSFQGPTNFANNYGTRVRGWIVAPQTGNYTFTLTSDDASVLYMSLNAEPQFAQMICNVPGWTNETEYTKYPSQVSNAIPLVAGRYYYVELLQKEGSGGDHFAVRWQTPSNSTRTIVPGNALVRWQNCQPSVRLRVNLQGAYDSAAGLMRDDLRALGLVPLNEPYQALGFPQVGGGGESTTNARLSQSGKNAVVDWVRVELRNKNNPSQVMATRSALLERDGDIVGTDGYARLIFSVAADNYFVAVRHRNHLGVMSQSSIALGPAEAGADFTLGTVPTWGTDARTAFSNGKRGLWCGNVQRDLRLSYIGELNDRDPILTLIGGSNPNSTAMGYHMADVTMDGMVRYIGLGNDRDPILVNIGGSVPTSVRNEQLP